MGTLGGCSRDVERDQSGALAQSPTSAQDFGRSIRDRITTDAVMAHLSGLQSIADANAGNRELGTSGYAASVDYIADALLLKGFDV